MTATQTQDTVILELSAACKALRSVCDGAYEEDGAGFNKVDAYLGHRLAALSPDEWTPEMAAAAYKVLAKYRAQLSGLGIDYTAIPRPVQPEAAAAAPAHSGWKRLFERAEERAARESREAAKTERERLEREPLSITLEGTIPAQMVLRVCFPYNAAIVSAVKAIRGARYQPTGRCWDLPYKGSSVEALVPVVQEFGRDGELRLLSFLQDCMVRLGHLTTPYAPPAEPEAALSVRISRGRVEVVFDYDARIVAACKAIPMMRYEPSERYWYGPITSEVAAGVSALTAEYNVVMPDDVSARLLSVLTEAAQNIETSASLTPTGAVVIPALSMPLRPFQQAGVEYMVRNKVALLGDQMGLGKTVQALAAVLAQEALPVLIITPASLKYNWMAEIAKWTPGLSAQMITGRGAVSFWGQAVIINYDILGAHLDALMMHGFKALVVDEAHMVKNRKAQRTQAVLSLQGIPVRYLLTGTPVLNRPVELVTPLTILGKLGEFGGFWGFVRRYCGAHQGAFGWDLTGATNLTELSAKLRAVCMVRRTTRDVFTELPPVERVTLPVEIDNRREYAAAEADLFSFIARRAAADAAFNASLAGLSEEEKEAARQARAADAVEAAERAETLVRIEALKQLAIRGKLRLVKEWVDNYLEGTDDKLLIFAHHREAQEAIAAMYPDAVQVLGTTSAADRQAAVDRFQGDPGVRIAVLSLAAGSVGLTLTEARHVLFVEFGWRPADHDQAEARAYGRVNDPHPVTAYYMVGQATIDEQIVELLEKKRVVADTVTEAAKERKPEIGITELITALRKRGGRE